MSKPDEYIIPMVDKTFQILDYLYNCDDEAGVSQISSDLNIPKATVFRIIQTAAAWGIIEKHHDSDKYGLGKTLIKMGQRVAGDMDVSTIATPFIKNASKELGESVNLGILYESSVLTINNAPGEDFYLISRLIPICPLNCSAMGKLFLSRMDQVELAEYFASNKPQKRTINSCSSKAEYLNMKKEIEETNIAYDREEYEYGLTCIGAPILDVDGEIVASISVSGPTTRLEYKGEARIIQMLKETAEGISKAYVDAFSTKTHRE